MGDLDDLIEAFLAIFVIFLLGYVFTLVFWQLSPIMAIVFIIVVGIILVGILLEIFRG